MGESPRGQDDLEWSAAQSISQVSQHLGVARDVVRDYVNEERLFLGCVWRYSKQGQGGGGAKQGEGVAGGEGKGGGARSGGVEEQGAMHKGKPGQRKTGYWNRAQEKILRLHATMLRVNADNPGCATREPDYEAITRKISGLQGGRRVQAETVVRWFHRLPSLPLPLRAPATGLVVGAGARSVSDGSQSGRGLPMTAVEGKQHDAEQDAASPVRASSTMAGHDHGASSSSKPAGGAAAASDFCVGDFVWATFKDGHEYKVSLQFERDRERERERDRERERTIDRSSCVCVCVCTYTRMYVYT